MAAVCPHCGFTQEESVAAKSTFCRKCQQHYSLERMLAGEKSIIKEPSFFSKISRLVLGERQREITCFTCSHKQMVSRESQSTMCPGCGAYMDLRDFKIAGPFGRSVQTAGDVHITSKGDVTSTRLLCGMLFLEGHLRGCVTCTGVATLSSNAKVTGTIDAAHITVDRKSDVEFVRPIRTKLFEVNGRTAGHVYADKVVIHKGGFLEGSVHAKAITVEKGGIFSGSLTIRQDAGMSESADATEPAQDSVASEEAVETDVAEHFQGNNDMEVASSGTLYPNTYEEPDPAEESAAALQGEPVTPDAELAPSSPNVHFTRIRTVDIQPSPPPPPMPPSSHEPPRPPSPTPGTTQWKQRKVEAIRTKDADPADLPPSVPLKPAKDKKPKYENGELPLGDSES